MSIHYHAHIALNAACGTYMNASTPEEAVKACVRLAFSDWKSTFDIAGKAVRVSVSKITVLDEEGNFEEETLTRRVSAFPVS